MVGVDIELTNRCNADCYFCPRDQTPHEGLMTQETFDQTLARAIEFRQLVRERMGDDEPSQITMCGLGEPMLNRRAATNVAQAREAGFRCEMSSNGTLLSEAKGEALLDAGLQRIYLNIGERDAEYEKVYGLPWQRTIDNVTRFIEMADGRCHVVLVLVDHRRDPEHVAEMKAFWQNLGVKQFHCYDIMNRGGALFVDHMQYDSYPEADHAWRMYEGARRQTFCAVPFLSPFVGYDGNFYLCCADWKKEVPLGSVHDKGFADVIRAKLEVVASRATPCNTCNTDPLNGLIDGLRGRAGGADIDVEGMHETMLHQSDMVIDSLERFVPGSTHDLPIAKRAAKRIPLLPA